MGKENFFIKNINILNMGLLLVIILLLLINTIHILTVRSVCFPDTKDTSIQIVQNQSDKISTIIFPRIFINREEWQAKKSKKDLEPLLTPLERVIVMETSSENCTTQDTCTLLLQQFQSYHMESNFWDDIGYNFIVGGDGAVYEGRGWDNQGAHTRGFNPGSIGIALIGTFKTNLPPERQLQAAKNLINEGVQLEKLLPNYKLYGHRQLTSSNNPSQILFDDIKKWPHWTAT